jgi:DNA helicase IV
LTAQRDIEEEQDFLDRAYVGLDAMRADASRMLDSVLDVGRGGTFQSRTERDIVVRTSLARLAQLDIGDQALCFGRIDRYAADGDGEPEAFHIGRLAVSGTDHEPLVVDWRAPVAEPFYRATGLDPLGLARRRHLGVRGRTVVGVEDEYFGRAGPGTGGDGRATDGDGRATDGDGRATDGDGRVAEGDGRMASGADATGTGAAATDGRGTGAVAPGEGAALLDGELPLGGPGALLAALGQARTGQMGDIVATIQREQDEIIRSPLAGVLMVQGGPGTGKTAVALHRAAYLLYTHRFPLERQGVLVVGPNPLFLRYIEQVLPSLGETGVTLSTVAGLVPEVRVRGTEPADVARLKGDARMVRVLARAVRTRQRPLRHDVAVPFGAANLRLTAAESADIVALARRRPGPHNTRRRFVEQQVVRRLADQYRRVRRDLAGTVDPVDAIDAIDVVDPAELGQLALFGGATVAEGNDGPGAAGGDELDVEEFGRGVRRVPELAEALDRMWPRLAPHELLHDLFGARPLLAAAGQGVLTAAEQALLYRPRSRALDEVPWTAADAALVDEARAILGPRRARARRGRPVDRERVERAREEVGYWPSGLEPNPVPGAAGSAAVDEDGVRSYGHIVVDEVQDLSPLQLRMLGRRSLSGSMTVVGDIAQATGPWAPSGWPEVAGYLTPAKPPRLTELTVSYRTPAEVVEVAAGVLAVAAPGVTPPRPVRRSGHRPTVVEVPPGALAERVAAVAEDEAAAVAPGRVAVLVPGPLHGELLRALASRGSGAVDPRDPKGAGLAAPLVVLPADEANGLEFDSVVVVEPALVVAGEAAAGEAAGGDARPPATTRGLRALYVALTRPTQRLAVVHSLPLPTGLALG